MQHLGAKDEMEQVWRNLLATLTPEKRLEGLSPEQRLRGLPPAQRIAGLTPEERLVDLSLEERLRGLTPAQRERMGQLLQQPSGEGDGSKPK